MCPRSSSVGCHSLWNLTYDNADSYKIFPKIFDIPVVAVDRVIKLIIQQRHDDFSDSPTEDFVGASDRSNALERYFALIKRLPPDFSPTPERACLPAAARGCS